MTGSFDDILKQSTKKKMEALVSEVIQPGSAGDFNQALIETGAMICIPGGAPLCSQCPFFTVCAARSQGLTEKLPVKTPKKKRKIEEKTVLLLEYQDKIAIRKRREDGLLASLCRDSFLPKKPERFWTRRSGRSRFQRRSISSAMWNGIWADISSP